MSDNSGNGKVESSSTFSFKWEVKQFSAYLDNEKNDLESPELLTIYANNLLHWRLRISKNHDRDGYENFVAIYLDYKDEIPLTVSAIFAVLSSGKQRVFQRVTKGKFNNKSLKYCGIIDFVEKSLITEGCMDLLMDDYMIITCEIRFQDFMTCANVNNLSSQFCRLDITEKSSDIDDLRCLSEDLRNLLENEKYSDVSFTFGDKKLHAHKNILTSRSRAFAKMFAADRDGAERKHSLVPLKDVNFDVMQEVLRYIYTGKVSGNESMAVELLVAAEKYALTELKTICEKTLIDKLKFDNAFDLLLIAKTFNAKMIKAEVMDFIISRLEDYVNTTEFSELNVAIKNDLLNALPKRNTYN